MSVDKRYIYTLNFKVKDRDNNNKASTSFYLNGYTLEFHLHTQAMSTGGRYCQMTPIRMVKD